MLARCLLAIIALETVAAADDMAPAANRNDSLSWSTTAVLDGFRTGLQYERRLGVTLGPAAQRWSGWRFSGVAGAGFSSIQAGHEAMPLPTADGAAMWLGGRLAYGGGASIDGLNGEWLLALQVGPLLDVVEGIQRMALDYRPGILMRFGRFQFGFAMTLEHTFYASSERRDLVANGWAQRFSPGVDVGLGVAW